MNDKVVRALTHLNSILPLKENQNKCDPQVKELHQQMLRSFVSRGCILNKNEMADWVMDASEAADVLNKYDMVTFSENGEPVGAYPFTMDERVHKVRVNGHQLFAMCALDALSIGPMFEEDTQISSQCKVSGDPVKIHMSGDVIQNLEEVRDVHFGIVWGAAESTVCCADSLCMEMIFLRDKNTAQAWLSDDSEGREVFTLLEAVQFSSQFFVPLLS